MNKIITSLLLFIAISINVSAQYVYVRSGSTVVIDGIASPMEWGDADSVFITISSGVEVTVKFKHDGSNFNFAFMGNLESFNVRFPEILFDIDNDKSAGWMNDWWFHVSATDCESNNAANDYSNCNAVQPDWTAESNFNTGAPITDTVEIQIPFTKVGFMSTQTDTIGLTFDVTNTLNAWNYWPSGASNTNPGTWGSAIIEFPTGVKDQARQETLFIYPNPASEFFMVGFQGQISSYVGLRVIDMMGKEVKRITINGHERIYSGDLAGGLYFLEINTGDGIFYGRFNKQ